jgi:hypothetical protein
MKTVSGVSGSSYFRQRIALPRNFSLAKDWNDELLKACGSSQLPMLVKAEIPLS